MLFIIVTMSNKIKREDCNINNKEINVVAIRFIKYVEFG